MGPSVVSLLNLNKVIPFKLVTSSPLTKPNSPTAIGVNHGYKMYINKVKFRYFRRTLTRFFLKKYKKFFVGQKVYCAIKSF